MCFSAAATMIGPVMGAVGQMAFFGAQQQQYQAKEQQYTQNYADALQDNRSNETNLTEREMQENASYSDRDHMALLEGALKDAQVMVAASSSGVAGNTVGALVNEIGEDINAKRATLEANWTNTAQQLQSAKDTDVVQEMTRINQVAPPYSPSPLGSIAGAVGDLAGDKTAANQNIGGFFGTATPSTALTTGFGGDPGAFDANGMVMVDGFPSGMAM